MVLIVILHRGRSREDWGNRPPKIYESNLFTTILYNLENNIRDIRPFRRLLFCRNSFVKILHLSYSNEAVMRLDYQILRKSPPLNLLAGSSPDTLISSTATPSVLSIVQ